MKHLVYSLAVAVGVMSATAAHAGYMTRTGASAFSGTAFGGTSDNNFWNDGGVVSSSRAAARASTASASVHLHADAGIRLASAAVTGGDVVIAQAIAAASWLDVIRVSGGAAPAKLRVTLEVEGELGLIRGVGAYTGSARVGLVMINSTSPVGGDIVDAGRFGSAYKVSEVYAAVQGSPYEDFFLTNNTVGLEYNAGTGAVRWKAVFDLDYSSALGGYNMNLYTSARGFGYSDGCGIAEFGHTIKLTGVTNSDGSDVDGDVTFDSGFRLDYLEEVPAPPAVVLAMLGVISLGGGAVGSRLRRAVKLRTA